MYAGSATTAGRPARRAGQVSSGMAAPPGMPGKAGVR
jgi:hypothetical protein